ncbi:acyl-CoA synthetase [uncultured Hydrogenophaga sp.]|uniref:acyl-CoA synthetase n=1 Tax=uncultured Hydrogenophaga sp. TaxID=199683 RepID=UPI00258314AC|nr:acyl-CoA synthetase [uncultured Hydrogenophaga sp.]
MRNLADIERFEREPLADRLRVRSTYELLATVCRESPSRPLLHFLTQGDAQGPVISWSREMFLAEVTRRANLFTELLASLAWADAHPALAPPCEGGVAVLLPNLPETYFSVFAAQQAAYAVPINPAMSADHVAHILKTANARVLVAPSASVAPEVQARALEAARLAGCVKHVLLSGACGERDRPTPTAADGADGYVVTPMASALAETPFDRLLVERAFTGAETAACFHTGGTTGQPKLARHTQLNEVVQAWTFAQLAGLGEDDCALVGLPLFHVHAVIPASLGPLSLGAPIVLAGPDGFRHAPLLADWWQLVERYDVTLFNAVPTVFRALLDVPVQGHDIGSLRLAISGSASMPATLLRDFEARTGLRILEGYGLTEGTCVSTLNPLDGERRIGSVGLRVPYQPLKVAELSGSPPRIVRECATGEVGSLLAQGPNVFPGYLDAAQSAQVFADGWLVTGDLARIDADGYVWLAGREKDIIKRSGHSIDPQTIEEALAAHPEIALVAAVGRPDARAGEVPVVYAVPRAGCRPDAEQLRVFVRGRIAEPHAVPADVVLIDAMPLTEVGKIFKPALRARCVREAVLATAAAQGWSPEQIQVEGGTPQQPELVLRGAAAVQAMAPALLAELTARFALTARWETT